MIHLLLWIWVGLTLIWVFHHLAQLHSHFCQIPISLGRIGQTVEPNPGLRADESPCTISEKGKNKLYLPLNKQPRSPTRRQTVLGCSLYGERRILLATMAGARLLLDTEKVLELPGKI